MSLLRRFWAHKFFFLAVVIACVLAGAAAIASRYSLRSSRLVERRSVTASSTTQVLADTRYSSLARLALPTTASTITGRTPLFADYAASLPVKQRIARLANVPLDSLSVTANTTETSTPSGSVLSTSYNSAPSQKAQRNNVVLSATDVLPIITVSSTSTSTGQAARLVDATVSALQASVLDLAKAEHVRGPSRMVLRQLGPATGSLKVHVTSVTKSVVVGVVVLIVLLLLILVFNRLRTPSASPREVSTAQ